ncbi:MAG: hypothetical protein KGZ97_04450 [Bacteroidetes bacterium]|nr:hypothetical protein [Bacteroidota bacterium]
MKNLNPLKFLNIKSFFMLLMLFVFTGSLFAQPPHGHGRRFERRSEEIHSRRVAFITLKVNLTSEEAQVFWPVYNEYNQKKDGLMQMQMFAESIETRIADMTDAEVLEFIEKEIVMMEKGAQLRREYHNRFLQILPVQKVALLYMAEKEFNRELFKEVRQRGPREHDLKKDDKRK